MVTAEMYVRFLKEQKIKEKKKKEKEESEKKYQEEIKKYAQKMRLAKTLEGGRIKKLHYKRKARKEKIPPIPPEERRIILEPAKIRAEKVLREKLERETKTKEQIIEIENRRKKLLDVRSKIKLCKSLQEIVSQVKDPDSIFTDIDLGREYTGCKIPLEKKGKKTKP